MRHVLSLLVRILPVVLVLTIATAFSVSRVAAATDPGLGTAASFAVLAASTVTNTGPAVVTGDLGVSPGTSVTGFPPGLVVGGTVHASDAVAAQAQSDVTSAYNALAGQACDTNLTGQNLGGLTLTAGVYCFASAAQLTGQLTLDSQGNPNSVFIFQIGSTLTTATAASVLLINGAPSCQHIFWQVGSSATLGSNTIFRGNILALSSITLNSNASSNGGLYARNGAITLNSAAVQASVCTIPATATATNTATATLTDTALPTSTLIPTSSTPTTIAPSTTAEPTAITLLYFSIKRTDNTLQMSWATSMELNTMGFNLYRSTTGARADAVRVTNPLITGHRGSNGGIYVWSDPLVEPDIHYTYWLQEVEASGKTREFGTVQGQVQPAANAYTGYLPIVRR